MATDKHALFQKRIGRVTRINAGQNGNLEPRRMRRVLRILELNYRFLWERDVEARHPGLIHPGKHYRRAIRRAH